VSSSALLPLFSALKRPVIAAAAAGAGSAAVWTFGRDLLTSTGGLPERTTAVLWCLLGAGAVLGAVSGDAVRRWGLGRAWVVTALATAAGTALFAVAASHAVTAELAGALFGGAYTALSGVLIAWAGGLRPDAVGRGTAVLFVALTTGQALGALGTGMLITRIGGPGAFLAAAALLMCAAAIAPDLRVRTP